MGRAGCSSGQQCWALTPAGTTSKWILNSDIALTLFKNGHLVLISVWNCSQKYLVTCKTQLLLCCWHLLGAWHCEGPADAHCASPGHSALQRAEGACSATLAILWDKPCHSHTCSWSTISVLKCLFLEMKEGQREPSLTCSFQIYSGQSVYHMLAFKAHSAVPSLLFLPSVLKTALTTHPCLLPGQYPVNRNDHRSTLGIKQIQWHSSWNTLLQQMASSTCQKLCPKRKQKIIRQLSWQGNKERYLVSHSHWGTLGKLTIKTYWSIPEWRWNEATCGGRKGSATRNKPGSKDWSSPCFVIDCASWTYSTFHSRISAHFAYPGKSISKQNSEKERVKTAPEI